MFKNIGLMCFLLAVGLAGGCKPKSSTASAPHYFQTPFQTESEFIVDSIVSDVAEQMYYAKFHRLPDQQYFSVSAGEKPGSPEDMPVYELHVRLDPKQSGLNTEVAVNGPIWSPTVYRDVATELARTIGLNPGSPGGPEDTSLLSSLSDSTAETIERENLSLSAALEADFGNPVLHEKAALLLGAFLLRDHSGYFFEIRSPLCRITAHLTMAAFLKGTNSCGLNGQMAQATLLTLIGDEAPALDRLDAVGTNEPAALPMIRALRARNTGDYRPLDEAEDLTRIESVAWFSALSDFVSASVAWPKLNDVQQRTIDFVREANQESHSVEMGHQLLAVSIPLEFREISGVYDLSHREKLSRKGLVTALNVLPERCFTTDSNGTVHVCIIGWGQWADFLQRHLCHAIQQDYYFLEDRWGVPDDAKEFAAKCDQQFGGLRLYPFVQRFDCADEASYHNSVDAGFKVTVATPQLVPADCWNWLDYKVNFAPEYRPNPNPHINEWHNHNPPPGTVYDLNARLNHPSLTERPDTVAKFEQLHKLAPYDCRIVHFILAKTYPNGPTYDQAMALYGAVLPYSLTALRTVAETVTNEPDRYEKLMLQAAALDPSGYYDLGNYALHHETNEDKAAEYFDKAVAGDPDSLRIAENAEWRERYYFKKGQRDKAREIADFAGEVYSSSGLEAKAVYFELITNYDEALAWYAKIEERYDDSTALIDFCQRYKRLTGSTRFDAALQQRMKRLFPQGLEKVSLTDFHSPPVDGAVFNQENERTKAAGVKQGDVIVAVYGVRVHNGQQYTYARGLKDTPELDLIVWHGGAYREFKPSPPNHLFGVDIDDYSPNQSDNP
jgi:tetratricopeptide (TPR) repeat protein